MPLGGTLGNFLNNLATHGDVGNVDYYLDENGAPVWYDSVLTARNTVNRTSEAKPIIESDSNKSLKLTTTQVWLVAGAILLIILRMKK